MKKMISLLLAFVLTFSLAGVCFAAEPTERVQNTVSPVNTDGGIAPIYAEFGYGSGTTSGYISGSFTVPAAYSGKTVRISWSAVPLEGYNLDAVFELTVVGKKFYLPAKDAAVSYTIGNLSSGTYTFSIVPYVNVTGEYVYSYSFSSPD